MARELRIIAFNNGLHQTQKGEERSADRRRDDDYLAVSSVPRPAYFRLSVPMSPSMSHSIAALRPSAAPTAMDRSLTLAIRQQDLKTEPNGRASTASSMRGVMKLVRDAARVIIWALSYLQLPRVQLPFAQHPAVKPWIRALTCFHDSIFASQEHYNFRYSLGQFSNDVDTGAYEKFYAVDKEGRKQALDATRFIDSIGSLRDVIVYVEGKGLLREWDIEQTRRAVGKFLGNSNGAALSREGLISLLRKRMLATHPDKNPLSDAAMQRSIAARLRFLHRANGALLEALRGDFGDRLYAGV